MSFQVFWKQLLGVVAPEKAYIPTSRAGRVLRAAKSQAAKARRAPTLSDVANELLAADGGGADAVLKSFPIDRAALLEALRKEPCAVPMQEVISLADTERRWLGHLNVGTEHLLLALVSHNANPVAAVFTAHQIDARSLREQLQKKLDPNFSD